MIDRLQDVLRLADGSRFSAALIENKLKFSPYVREAVAIGEARPHVVALIQIDMGNVGNWAEANRLPFTTFKDLSRKDEVTALIGEAVARVNEGLPAGARIRGFALFDKELDADDDELTRTQKVRRATILTKYEAMIEDLYAPGPRVTAGAAADDRRSPPPSIMNEHVVFMLQLIITGVAVGGVYSLIALGFVLIFKASSVVNFGPGELVLFGAYVAWATILSMKLPLYVALPLTLVIAIVLGLVIERGVLRPLIGQPIISVIMVTFGVASVIRGFLNMTWGSDTRPFPVLFSQQPFHLGPVPVSPVHLWSFVAVMALLAGFSVFFRFSTTGMAMRATADNQQVALSLGVSVKRIFALSWCIASVVSALGGTILGSVRGGVDFSLADLGLKVFPVVILGGLDSVPGAIIGGVLIGVLENLAGGYLDPIMGGGVKEVAPFVALVIILMLRPYGFFGKREIERV